MQHQINLIFGVSLPNLSHNHMGPKETEAMQHIVKELLARQLI